MAAGVPVSVAQITVTTAGTSKPLSTTSLAAMEIYVSAPSGNTGSVFVGDSTVSSTRGIEIPKGTTQKLCIEMGRNMDLKDWYVDAATSGDKLNVVFIKNI